MVNTITDNLILKSQFIYPRSGTTLVEQLSDCYTLLAENHDEFEIFKKNIVKQSVFISVQSNNEYAQNKQFFLRCAKDFFGFSLPTSIIPQSPEKGSLVLELTTVEGFTPNKIIRKNSESVSWIVLEKDGDKMVFASGFSCDLVNTDILLQSNKAFNKLEEVLNEEEMQFSDIVRQWNYIEQIVENELQNGEVSQHYQIFNDVRSKFYNKAEFIHGYPAATGIGMDFGGVVIDVIAFKSSNKDAIIPLKSNIQVDAYRYSKEVLAENKKMTDFSRTTPKFERAKILTTPNCKCIFVSGTAAIKGQSSIPLGLVEEQTEITIQNILSLISAENIKKTGIKINKGVKLNHLRVYVKYFNDIQKAKQICLNYFPQLPIVYLVADICRPELLVEIEGYGSLD